MSLERVVIVGGGLAGLSAAVVLSGKGLRVCLLEKRPHLGGRATSYDLPDGSHVDNCQHVTLGCCTNLADFYRRVDAENRIRSYETLHFANGRGRRYTIAASPLPPPLHLAPSFLRFGALNFADKRAIARALFQIIRGGGRPPGASGRMMLEWLRSNGQTQGAIERFWRVVLVSALDEDLARMDAQYAIDVFWKGFLSSREGFQIGIPDVPLAELYSGCQRAIEKRGGEVRCRAPVRQIRVDGNQFGGLLLDSGEEIPGDACIVAAPHTATLEMLPREIVEREGAFSALRNLRTSPITGVHFWYDRAVMKEPYLALLDHTVQWIFNKSALYRGRDSASSATNDSGQYLQLVISASYDLVAKSRQEIIEICCRDLAEILPTTRSAELRKATVVKEVAATFSPEPDAERWRPAAQTPIRHLFLAGDWTQTGWPATMEGAVRSGYLAAEALLGAASRPHKFLQPDLPVQGLCRLWARKNTRKDV